VAPRAAPAAASAGRPPPACRPEGSERDREPTVSISGPEITVLFRLFHSRPLPSTGLQEFRGRSQELEGALNQAAPPQRGPTRHGRHTPSDRWPVGDNTR